MKHSAYTLHDVKAGTYSPPFYQPNDALAKRLLADLVADLGTTPGRHPADFRMYKIGTFEDSSGVLQCFDALEHVADAISFVRIEFELFKDVPQETLRPSNGKAL